MKETSNFARVVVTACGGAGEGALCTVRALGRQGVPVTVVSEEERSYASMSRYCSESYIYPNLTRNPDEAIEFLQSYAKRQEVKPVLFPTADPDLMMFSRFSEELKEGFHLILPEREIVESFSDKKKFSKIAKEQDFPVPKTIAPTGIDEVEECSRELSYPVILKPDNPYAWKNTNIQVLAGYKKAIRIDSREQLISTYTEISRYDPNLLIQEYIYGPDEDHYDIHIYMDKKSNPVAFFTGQKLRIYPAYAGSGCFVRSRLIEPIVDISFNMLKKVKYTGLANINFKRDSVSGQYKLLEINPRVSQWNVLASECGINLPYIAYADATGVPYQHVKEQEEDKYYISFKSDFKAFLEYRRNNDWTLKQYILSLMKRKIVHQVYARDDLKPFFVELMSLAKSVVNKLLRIKPA